MRAPGRRACCVLLGSDLGASRDAAHNALPRCRVSNLLLVEKLTRLVITLMSRVLDNDVIREFDTVLSTVLQIECLQA